jgi:hypothetical protein
MFFDNLYLDNQGILNVMGLNTSVGHTLKGSRQFSNNAKIMLIFEQFKMKTSK